MSNIISLANRRAAPAQTTPDRRPLVAEVAELRRQTELLRAASADMRRAMDELQNLDITSRAREIRDAKLASL